MFLSLYKIYIFIFILLIFEIIIFIRKFNLKTANNNIYLF